MKLSLKFIKINCATLQFINSFRAISSPSSSFPFLRKSGRIVILSNTLCKDSLLKFTIYFDCFQLYCSQDIVELALLVPMWGQSHVLLSRSRTKAPSDSWVPNSFFPTPAFEAMALSPKRSRLFSVFLSRLLSLRGSTILKNLLKEKFWVECANYVRKSKRKLCLWLSTCFQPARPG